MGCFLACFGSSKDKKRRRQRHKVLPRQQKRGGINGVEYTVSLAHTEKPSSSVSDHQRVVIKDTSKEYLSLSSRKKVTFNSNVKTYEHEEVTEFSQVEAAGVKREEYLAKPKKSESHSEDSSITSSSCSYPPNHRYQNCRDSDDELEYEESDIDDDDDDDEDGEDYGEVDYDDPCENDQKLGFRFGKNVNDPVIEEIDAPVVTSSVPEREVKVNPSARDRSTYVHPVLNPVENLSQWKAVKAKGIPPLSKQKENLRLGDEPRIEASSEPCFRESSFSFKASSDKSKKPDQEIAVDASLSNWLGNPESTPIPKTSTTRSVNTTPERSMPPGSSSPSSFDDRPILGALTVEEIKQISANCSPKRSPSRSPDEMPIIGTVGTYWNDNISDRDAHSVSSFKGIPNTTSKYREDRRVKWHSTPFETRLERALSGGVAGGA